MSARARQRSLDGIFRPRAVAVVGASRRADAIGRQVVKNAVAAGFVGPVYPVNPKTKVVESMQTHPSVAAIPGPVDLAVLVVPPDDVLRVAEQCGRKGVKGLVVITAGFREIGGAGVERERKLCAIARRHGMRVIGPNCMGVINTAADVSLNASFAGTLPPPGRVAMVSQSGALGEAILADATAAGLGVAMFASVGNRADVTAADLIEYWEHDPQVQVILLYIESLGAPAHFVEVARRVSRHKPIIAVKSGRSAAGAAAAGSHTGAVAGADVAADTLLSQCGVLRVESFRQMFSLAATLLHQPPAKGPRIAVVTNAGGPGILATDALVGGGLQMALLGSATTRKIQRVIPAEASAVNPVDLIASADADRYRRVLRAVVADPGVDGLIVMFVSPVMIDAEAVARAIVDEAHGRGKPVLACVMGRRRGNEAIELLRGAGVPVFRYPEDAAQTMRKLVRRGELLHRRRGPVPRIRANARKVRGLLAGASGWLGADLAERVVREYGVAFPPSRSVATAGDAVAAAHELGFPVVVKAEAAGLLHKSEHRAVAVDLHDGDDVFDAAQDLLRRLGRKFDDLRLRVQAQARGHREILVGMTRDPRYGPLFAVGLGGTQVEVLRDVAVRIGPLDRQDTAEMFASLKGAPLLGAFRGAPAVSVDTARDVLLRLQQLVADHPRVAEVEINPMVLGTAPADCLAVDARIRLEDA